MLSPLATNLLHHTLLLFADTLDWHTVQVGTLNFKPIGLTFNFYSLIYS